MKLELSWYEGDTECSHTFPAKNAVCDMCEGNGTVLNPSIAEHAYTSEEFDEAFPEEEDKAQYFQRGGMYDVACNVCKGVRVIPAVDETRFSANEKALFAKANAYKEEDARERAAEARTMYYENGGY